MTETTYYVEQQYSATGDVSSELIAWWGNGYHGFSHTDAVVPGGLLGARWDNPGKHGRGVQLRPMGYEKWTRVTRVRIPVTEDVYMKWLNFLGSQIKSAYDPDDILRLILGQKTQPVDSHWICSALAARADQICGIFPAYLGVPPQQITPDGHRELLITRPGAQYLDMLDWRTITATGAYVWHSN